MLVTIIILFAVAAVIGVTIIIPFVTGKPVSKTSALFHGLFAATALVLLIIFAVNSPGASPIASIIIFVIAALGGLVLFISDMKNKRVPAGVAFIHAGAAVIAFILLLVFALA